MTRCDLIVANEEYARTAGFINDETAKVLARFMGVLLVPQGMTTSDELEQRSREALIVDMPMQTVPSALTGKVFNMAAGSDIAVGTSVNAFVDDPALLVIPSGLTGDYITIHGKGALALRNTAQVLEEVDSSALLTRAIGAVTVCREAIVHAASVMRTSLASTITALTLSLAILVLASAILASTCTRRHSRKLFVQNVHGWSFLSAFPYALVGESLLVASAGGWVVRSPAASITAMDPILTFDTVLSQAIADSRLAFAVVLVACCSFLVPLAWNYASLVSRTLQEG